MFSKNAYFMLFNVLVQKSGGFIKLVVTNNLFVLPTLSFLNVIPASFNNHSLSGGCSFNAVIMRNAISSGNGDS